MDTQTVASTFNIYQALINLGLAGALMAAVVVPTLRWIMAESSAQRQAFVTFINDHASQETSVLTKIESTLQVLMLQRSKEVP